jgi:hemerythrin-like domain-containing protein
MKATDQLKAEHEGIRLMMRIMDKICRKLESGEDVDPDQLANIVEFFKVFVDKCHHGKEEDLLFPALEKAGITKEGGPIGRMLVEHDQGRGFARGLAESVEKYASGDRSVAAEISANARSYMALLDQHIQKEDLVLFQMADSRLGPDEQGKLFEEFEKLEETRIGSGKHEQFHGLLDRLARIYLNLT